MKTLLLLLHVALPLIGIADAGYMTYEKMQGVVPPCGSGFDCGAVLSSSYASIGPVPLSLIGLFYYATLFVLGSMLLLEIEIQNWMPKKLKPFLNTQQLYTTFSTLGLAFSLYLVFVMAVLIKGWCLYCLISAAVSAALFIVSWSLFKRTSPSSHVLLKTISHYSFGVLYRYLLKPIFFRIDPETVHDALTSTGALLGRLHCGRALTHLLFGYVSPSTQVVKDGITFPTPLGLSAGFDYNGVLTNITGPVGFGFQTVGTVTLGAYAGNTKPRLGRFPNSKALLVNKGLKSLGAKAIIKNLENKLFSIPIGISIGATNTLFETEAAQIRDILTTFSLFEKSSVRHSYYELNISCPNTFGGEPFTTPHRLEILLTALDALQISRPVYIKMPIDQSEQETKKLLDVAAAHSISGLVFGNLTKDKNNPDVTKEDRDLWKTQKGNLSGKPTFARSTNLLRFTKKQFGDRFTLIGCGGIFDEETAQAKLAAGADLLQMVTGMIFGGPQTVGSIVRQLDIHK